MALRWLKNGRLLDQKDDIAHTNTRVSKLTYDPLWRLKMIMNGFGALCTGVVMLIFAITKFQDGAYVILILIPSLIGILWMIHIHYRNLARKHSLDNFGIIPPHTIRHRVIMPVSGVHQGTLAGLRYARMLADDVTAVHIVIEPADAEKVRKKWETWGEGVRLVVLDSPYRLFVEPLLGVSRRRPHLRRPPDLRVRRRGGLRRHDRGPRSR